jgi:hypothetical protein
LRSNPEPVNLLEKDFQNLEQAVHDLLSGSHNPRKLKDLASWGVIARVLPAGYVKTAGIKSLQAFGYHFG